MHAATGRRLVEQILAELIIHEGRIERRVGDLVGVPPAEGEHQHHQRGGEMPPGAASEDTAVAAQRIDQHGGGRRQPGKTLGHDGKAGQQGRQQQPADALPVQIGHEAAQRRQHQQGQQTLQPHAVGVAQDHPAGHEHQHRRQPRRCLAGQAPAQMIDQHREQHPAGGRDELGAEGIDAEHVHRQRREPEEQGRLVQIQRVARVQDQPVVAVQQLLGDQGIADGIVAQVVDRQVVPEDQDGDEQRPADFLQMLPQFRHAALELGDLGPGRGGPWVVDGRRLAAAQGRPRPIKPVMIDAPAGPRHYTAPPAAGIHQRG